MNKDILRGQQMHKIDLSLVARRLKKIKRHVLSCLIMNLKMPLKNSRPSKKGLRLVRKEIELVGPQSSLPETFIVKNRTKIFELQHVQANTLIVLAYFVKFCEGRGLPCILTNILDKFAQSTSNVHPEGRGFDARSMGFSNGDIEDCIRYMEFHCGSMGAISASDNKQRVVIHHDIGLAQHFHFQTKR